MRRREFLGALGGAAAAWPLAARAQQPALPVIGYLDPTSPDTFGERLRAFRQGLKEAGYVEGENVAIEYRWAENQMDQLPTLAADLVRRQVAVIATSGGPAPALAAKAATMTIPIVFAVGEDPVRLGLVTSLARPGANLTGINFFTSEVATKRLELLRELVPGAIRVAVFVNPANAAITEATVRDVETAARAMGLQVQFFNAKTSREIDTAFATFARERPDALFKADGFITGTDPIVLDRREQIISFAHQHKLPSVCFVRQFAEAGSLLSYGPSISWMYRQAGDYVGQILKGAKPTEMPVLQPTQFELVINLKTARAYGLTIPLTLQAAADDVIE